MASSCQFLNQFCLRGRLNQVFRESSSWERSKRLNGRNQSKGNQVKVSASLNLEAASSNMIVSDSLGHFQDADFVIRPNSNRLIEFLHNIPLADLDPESAKLAIAILGPVLSTFGFLFILRIVMSWYPKLPVDEFPYVIAYAPTEPILELTRKVIPPLGGVDVTPVVWFGLISFVSEILVGRQGLLVLVSQQQVS